MKRLATGVLILIAVVALFVSCNDEAEKVQLCKVTFDLKGGKDTVETQAVIKNKTAIEPESPQKDHYVFAGWLLNGKKFDFNTAITEDITLWASWIREDYKVTFNANEGTIDGEDSIDKNVKYNDTVTAPNDPTRTGYTFLGWYCEADKFDFNIRITSDLALTAKWEKKIVTYTVTFNPLYGAAVTQTVEEGQKANEPTDPTCEGSTFLGWYKGDVKYDFDNPVTENIVLDARWEASGESTSKSFYDVQFVDEDGSFLYGTKVTEGATISTIDPVSKDRHKTFYYWRTEDGTKFDFNTKITEAITLTAVWRDLKVGDKGPAGGIIFYDEGSVKTSVYYDEFGNKVSYLWRYLEAAPDDLNEVYYFGYYRMSDNGENKTAGTGFNIGEGRLSTASLVHHMYNPAYVESGGNTKDVYAAAMCWNYTYINLAAAKKYTDWFLPSVSELAQMYEKKYMLNMDGEYWSSTEDDWDTAYYIDFDSGNLDSTYRYYGCRVRPIRAF